MYRVEDLPISIPIGRQGENHAMKIEIDCSSFLAEWPQATITAMLKRSVAENPYILITSIDSKGVLTWEPTAHDTGIEGDGQIEIRAVENDVLAKSVTAIVCVERSLTPPEPDTPIDWVEDIKSDIAQSVTSAANSATDAALLAASAQESAAEAAGSANAAQSSANAAAGSASAASKSATSAAGSADAASGSASAAAQSAAEADKSAKASAASAAAAAGTLEGVKASADAAAESARAAAESASEAAGSKDAAAKSASEAAASAAAAEKAAQDAAGIIDDTIIAEGKAWSSKNTVDKFLPMQIVTGNPAIIETIEGYPLELSASWEPIQEGSGTPSMDNVRPIIKKENVTISRYSTNLINAWNKIPAMVEKDGLKIEKTQDGRLHVTGNKSTSSDQGTDIFRIDIDTITLPKGTYSWGEAIVMQSSQGNLHTSPYVCNETITIHALYATVYEQKKYDQYYVPALVVGVTKPTQGADKYVASTKNVVLPKIICGGKIRAANGTGQETWGYIASYAGESLPGEWISDRNVYADGAQPTIGAQVVYKLATPEAFAATGSGRIDALAGTNTILTDADTVTITAPTPPQATVSAAEAQAAKLDYIAMMADVDMDDLLAVDDAGTDGGMDMDMPTDIEGSETDGEQEV